MPSPTARKAVLILTQAYPPDPQAVGQYMAEAAREMRRRGYRVIVFTADRGYDDPTVRYERRETDEGVEVRRLPFSSLGKSSIPVRVMGLASFSVQCLIRGLLVRDLGGILFGTSPPMIGVVASLLSTLRGAPGTYWAMDLNPDQLIALGKLRPGSVRARALEAISRSILHRARSIVALDRFMAERIRARSTGRGAMTIIPPWPHERLIAPVLRETNTFRARYGLSGKKVVMYSGNHTHSNPLDTLLDAILRLRDHPTLHFVFIGGGQAKAKVEGWASLHNLRNVLCLPYQPFHGLRESLAAGDVHVVTLGNNMAGIIHPSKVYAAMAAARPLLYIGPTPSHVTDILDAAPVGWRARHGDIDSTVAALEQVALLPHARLDEMGRVAQALLQDRFSEEVHRGRLGDLLEQTFA